MVTDLMMDGSRAWNLEKIDDILWPVDQELIKEIPYVMEMKVINGSGTLILKAFIRLWRLPIPPKVWLFIWRAFHVILSTMVSLHYRGIDCDCLCPRYFLRTVISEIPMKDLAMVYWLAWKLWCERNKVPVQQQVVGWDVWLPPQPGYLKLNVDASVSSGSDHIGIGTVIRNENGRIYGSLAKSVDETFSPFLAECIALCEGLKIAKMLEIVTLVVETDATNVVSTVSDDLDLSLEGPILEDVK
ncbi:hypothetical protein TIFTF001_006731 [Ficus carica]|uniref:RNase H type-1 domain-containing protein n=1 Tax=Ficus carica TaxID=3494 RepID=A0AA88A4U4_FICCA|nr:hypothetical protein TIFTF001_006731 [Ficus carica]